MNETNFYKCLNLLAILILTGIAIIVFSFAWEIVTDNNRSNELFNLQQEESLLKSEVYKMQIKQIQKEIEKG